MTETADLAPRLAPSPDEVARAGTGPSGGWSAEQLASWGIPWPAPKGWRAELARRHALGLEITPLAYAGKKARQRNSSPKPATAPSPMGNPSAIFVTDIGTPDPNDLPPWMT